MASNMSNIEQETVARSCRIINEKVQVLFKVWKTFFDDISYLSYMTSLPESIGLFLDEIFHLTMHYCSRKNKDIQDLNEEANQLHLLLDVPVPREDWELQPMSLDRRFMLVQKKVNVLRLSFKRQLERYVQEQSQLCRELGSEHPFYQSFLDLPNDETMRLFKEYLEGLRQKKASRLSRIAQLQADLRSVAKQLDWEPRKPEQKLLLNEQNLPPSEQTIHDLEVMYGVLYNLMKGKLLLQTQTEPEPVPDNLSPPPPPPSPEADLASSQQSTGQKTQSQLQPTDGVRRESLLEANIRRYRQLQGDACSGYSRERIITEIFEGIHDSINRWWDRCLISHDERKRSKVMQRSEPDEDAMVAHEEEQKRLKAYYYENETLFQVIYQWAEWWSTYLQLEPNAGGRGVGGKLKKKPSATAMEKDYLRQVKEQLTTLEGRLKELCDEFERRTQSKFTMFGQPAMSMLMTHKETRKELTLPSSCKVRPSRAMDRKANQVGGNPACRATLPTMATIQRVVNIASQWAEKTQHVTWYTKEGRRPSSPNSSSDGEEDNTRDDELLEEAFASATASTAIKKRRIEPENGVGSGQGSALSDDNNEASETPAGPPLPIATVIKETPKNCSQTAVDAMDETSSSGTDDEANVPSRAHVDTASASLDCAGSDKACCSKSKQNVEREPSLII